MFDMNLQHQRVNDICILKNRELLERLHSLECSIGSRHGKGCKFLNLFIMNPQGHSVSVSCGVSGS